MAQRTVISGTTRCAEWEEFKDVFKQKLQVKCFHQLIRYAEQYLNTACYDRYRQTRCQSYKIYFGTLLKRQVLPPPSRSLRPDSTFRLQLAQGSTTRELSIWRIEESTIMVPVACGKRLGSRATKGNIVCLRKPRSGRPARGLCKYIYRPWSCVLLFLVLRRRGDGSALFH